MLKCRLAIAEKPPEMLYLRKCNEKIKRFLCGYGFYFVNLQYNNHKNPRLWEKEKKAVKG